jgi:hypothetical protein
MELPRQTNKYGKWIYPAASQVKRCFGIYEKALYMHVDYTDNLIDWCGDTDLLSLSRYKLMT